MLPPGDSLRAYTAGLLTSVESMLGGKRQRGAGLGGTGLCDPPEDWPAVSPRREYTSVKIASAILDRKSYVQKVS